MAKIDARLIIEVLKYLFREYTAAMSLDSEQVKSVEVKRFLRWCLAHDQPGVSLALLSRDPPEGLALGADECAYLQAIFSDNYDAFAMLLSFWDSISRSAQPPVKETPMFLHVAVTAGYAGEKAWQVQTSTKFKPEERLTEGFLCTQIKFATEGLMDLVRQMGFNRLRDEQAVAMGKGPIASIQRELQQEHETDGL